MYIEITTRCNMKCAHCARDANEIGEDMTLDIFKQAIEVCVNLNASSITLGGGEPTIHPEFMEMLNYAIETIGKKAVISIITNGSMIDISMKLADMADAGLIHTEVSVDDYHDKIDNIVIDRFAKIKQFSFFKNNAHKVRQIIKAGRGKDIIGAVDGCMSGIIHINTNGDVYTCGCLTEHLGTVFNYEIPQIDCSSMQTDEYFCQGWCSNYGHLKVKNPLPEIERAEAERKKQDGIRSDKARITIAKVLNDYYQHKYNKQQCLMILNQLRIKSEVSNDEFNQLVKAYKYSGGS